MSAYRDPWVSSLTRQSYIPPSITPQQFSEQGTSTFAIGDLPDSQEPERLGFWWGGVLSLFFFTVGAVLTALVDDSGIVLCVLALLFLLCPE